MAAPRSLDRPAFYALRPGGWRDLLTLLHLPYTGWHLSYVAFGAVAAPVVHGDRLAATLLAFFLGVGISAHALDELTGRPLGTRLSDRVLVGLAVAGLAGAVAVGIVGVVTVSAALIPFVVAGAFILVAYNLELFGGRFHSDLWFAVAWGAFPVVTGAVAVAGTVRAATVIAAVWATVLSLAQRRLSTPVRRGRREVVSVTGELELAGGSRETVTHEALVEAPEAALKLLAAATVLIAAALVAFRL
jgi:hypothetical protein